MDWTQIATIAGSVVVPLGTLMGWIWSRLDKKFDRIDSKIEDLRDRVGHIEGYLMGPQSFISKKPRDR